MDAVPTEPTPIATRAPRIRVLPPEIADQIAAGEVVERPASVVKELVENSLDAGARRIDVDVEGGGRRLIRVVDDGCGMSAEEARLALRRHATSKLDAIDDLFAIATMGFRGEALPSVAAVSRLALVTRTADSVEGHRLEVEAGIERALVPVGAPVGTTVEVRDLLFNVPARLKFLKAEATEAGHVTEAVTRLALANPVVHLRLRHGGRVALDLPPHATPLERVRAVVGRRLGARLFAADGEEGGVVVRAFLAPPDEAQTTSRGVQLFVGRRFVRDRGLLHAVVMGYAELVAHGRYPTAIVFIDPPGDTVDVNVHPQKVEVRFARPQEVYAAVRHVVGRALASAPWLAETGRTRSAPVSMYAVTSPIPPPAAHVLSDVAADYADRQAKLLTGLGPAWGGPSPRPAWRRGDDPGPARRDVDRPLAPAPGGDGRTARPPEGTGAPTGTVGDAVGATTARSDAGAGATASPVSPLPGASSAPTVEAGLRAPEAWPPPPTAAAAVGFFGSLAYLGQLDRTYLVCEGAGELVLIDQHAAHERIAFQRLREAHAKSGPRTQRLLFARTVELDPAQAAAAQEHRDALEATGFELEPFGGSRWALKASPVELREGEVVSALTELLTELADTEAARAVGDRLDQMFATIACHSVVRAGDVLSPTEARALLQSMDEVDFRGHCPHGRPVLLRIDIAEIARRFGRT